MNYEATLEFARRCDQADPLRGYRDRFYIPQHEGKDSIYLCGNSLGLQPKSVVQHIQQELDDWRKLGVDGHLQAKNPWYYYHHRFAEPSARIVGALPHEVVVMNGLTVNAHLLMVSFYRPSKSRFKILVEDRVFPSDYYALESQIRFHGFDPREAIVEAKPRTGEHHLRMEDIVALVEQHRDSLALVYMGGVNYYTGQYFDIEAITRKAHQAGALAGFNMAHGAGNVIMKLHDWDVDFACWCSYKYLNSGPGGPAGAFIHGRHHMDANIPRFHGWWGHDEESRFEMKKEFVPMRGADVWQLSNAPVLGMAAHYAALEVFEEAGMQALAAKSRDLTGYLFFLLKAFGDKHPFTIITPEDPGSHGCQVSILTGPNGRELFDGITAGGVVADWRHPNVIRVAPVPLYNTFEDVYRFAELLCT